MRKNKALFIRLSEAEYKELKRRASELGLSTSQYVRTLTTKPDKP